MLFDYCCWLRWHGMNAAGRKSAKIIAGKKTVTVTIKYSETTSEFYKQQQQHAASCSNSSKKMLHQ